MAVTVETGAEAAHKVGFPPFNSETFTSQLLWLAITFGFLYWFVSKIALPRIASVIEERHKRIQDDLGEAGKLKARAEEAAAAYEAGLAQAKAEANTIAEDTRSRLSSESETRRKSLEADLSAKIAAAEQSIQQTRTQAMGHVEGIASDTAASIVETLLGQAPEAGTVSTAVKTALAGR